MELSPRALVTRLFNHAGIDIGGNAPWDIRVNNPRFYRRVLQGSVGLGESYTDGDWDTPQLDSMIQRLLRTGAPSTAVAGAGRILQNLRSRIANMQTRRGSRAMAEQHYDLDHRLYTHFLGPHNQYTCCFFDGTDELRVAEECKLEMLCEKLELGPGDRVLDVGCGWGGFVRYAASTRGCTAVGISLSAEQIAYARKYAAGFDVEIVRCDYRDLPDRFPAASFDKILVCGMLEHVGYKNYRRLMKIIHELLSENGLFLLHTIGNKDVTTIVDPWIEKYIFRNSMIPAMSQIADAVRGLFVIQAWENYGYYYSKTLRAWYENFNRNWPRIMEIETRQRFDERFRRMWNYYLLSCKAAFDVEELHLWQIVTSKYGARSDVYRRVMTRNCATGQRQRHAG